MSTTKADLATKSPSRCRTTDGTGVLRPRFGDAIRILTPLPKQREERGRGAAAGVPIDPQRADEGRVTGRPSLALFMGAKLDLRAG